MFWRTHIYEERPGLSGLSLFPTKQSISHAALLFSEVRAELLFLLFGQVSLNDLELLAFDGISNLVYHCPARQQEQGRSTWSNLRTHLVDEALVDPIVSKVPHQGTDRGAHRQAEKRDKEQQAEQKSPERTTQCADPGHTSKLLSLRFTGSNRPGDDGPIFNLDQLLLLQVLQRIQHRLGALGCR